MIVVCICGDPGGARAVAPVADVLRSERGVSVSCVAYDSALSILEDFGFQADELPRRVTPGIAATVLDKRGAHALLAASSFGAVNWEKQFILEGRDRGVFSVAVLDSWTNYKSRFTDAGGTLAYVPDAIAAIDAEAAVGLCAAGLPPERIVVTGHPALEIAAQTVRATTSAGVSRVRQAAGVDDYGVLVVFVSQPIRADSRNGHASDAAFAFDEYTIFELIVGALDAIGRDTGREITLLIRPHPRDRFELPLNGWSHIRVVVDGRTNRHDQLVAADMVIGMNSELLVEACYLGAIVVSIQPGQAESDRLPVNKHGFSRPIYDTTAVRPVVEKLLFDTTERARVQDRLRSLPRHTGAARAIADLTQQRQLFQCQYTPFVRT